MQLLDSDVGVSKAEPNTKRKKLRVLYFDHTAVLSGGELALLEAVRNLDRAQTEPLVVLGEHGPLEQELQSECPLWVLELPSKLRNTRKDNLTGMTGGVVGRMFLSIPYIFKLARLLRQIKPDIVHTNSLKADLLGGIAARMCGIRLVWHVRDRISPDYLPRAAVTGFRWLIRLIPHYVVGCSQSVIDTLNLPAWKRRKVVYSGIDLEVYESMVPRTRHAAEGGAADPVFIGLVGRIGRWKGQHTFLEAAAKVHRVYPQTRFLLYGSAMFGEGAYEKRLHAMVADLGLQDVFEFCGFERNIAGAIVNLDILVHASTTPEPFGQVIVQGMAAGKPVIASAGGGALEIIRHGVDGLLFTLGDAGALADAMIELLGNPQFASELARNGRERVRGCFTIQHTVHSLTSVFQELVEHY